jgi:hypothetical protein
MSGSQYDLTANFGLKKPRSSGDPNLWGDHLNQNMDQIDDLLATIATTNLPVTALGTIVSPTLALDLTLVRAFTCRIATNVALVLTTNTPPAVLITGLIVITQDAVGSRDIAWPNNFRWQGGYAPSLSVVPGATDILQVTTFDGGATWFAAIALQAPP